MNFAARLVAGLALSALLSACVPIPYSVAPGFRGSRADLGDALPAFIVIGSTTRVEVLLKMPRPEFAAPDNSWFYFESNYMEQESGAVFVSGFPVAVPVGASGTSARLFRRLYIRFDDSGVVSNADFDRQRCSSDSFIDPLAPTPSQLESCAILKRGLALREESRAQHVRLAAGADAADAKRYDAALWKEGVGLPSMWANLRDDPLNCHWAKGFGTLVVTRAAIVFLPRGTVAFDTHGEMAVERAQIAKITPFGRSMVNFGQTAGFEITRTNGKTASLTLCDARNNPALEMLKEVGVLLGAPMQ